MIEAEILAMLDDFENCVLADKTLDANVRTHFHHLYLILLRLHCPQTLERSARRLDVMLGESPADNFR